jgi:DNA-binding CsgD family transcriptional regulator
VPEPDIYLPPGTHALRFLLQGTDVRWLHLQTFEWRIPAISADWSAPVGNPSLLLPALTTGDHTLEFRARVGSVLVGPILQLTVHIPPPWYMTPWARLLFALLLLIAVGWLLHLRKRRWERKRKADLARQHEEMLQVSRQFQQSLQASEEALARERLARSEAELTGKNQELASTTMHLVQKSEVLQTIRQRLSALKPQLPRQVAKDIQGILDLTQQDERLDANWEQFSQHFDQVHVDFQNRLRERYPHLTKNDLKLCAYIRLNLSSKEIASLMFVTVRAVEISRFRLRKRLDLDKGINLNEFIQRI